MHSTCILSQQSISTPERYSWTTIEPNMPFLMSRWRLITEKAEVPLVFRQDRAFTRTSRKAHQSRLFSFMLPYSRQLSGKWNEMLQWIYDLSWMITIMSVLNYSSGTESLTLIWNKSWKTMRKAIFNIPLSVAWVPCKSKWGNCNLLFIIISFDFSNTCYVWT